MTDFTYDPTTDLGELRGLIADTRKASHGFTDAELNAYLAAESNVHAAAVRAMDLLIVDRARRARVFTEGDLQVDESATLTLLREQRDSYAERGGMNRSKVRVRRMREPDWSPAILDNTVTS